METEVTINTSDIVIHVDENLDDEHRQAIVHELRNMKGVVSVSNHKKTAHLLIVMYDHNKVNSVELLACAMKNGTHAELVGL